MAVEISLKTHQEKPFWVIGRQQLITLMVDILTLVTSPGHNMSDAGVMNRINH